MDETGFQIGSLACTRVIIDASSCTTPYRTHPGRQKWVSVLECICTDGSTVLPLFILKGTGVNTSHAPDGFPAGWGLSSSAEGWTTNTHGLQ